MTSDDNSLPRSALHVRPGVAADTTRIVRPPVKRRVLSAQEHVEGVLARDRAILGRTFTLVESSKPTHREKAREVLAALAPKAGMAIRLGITGIPGVGKSTFIEALGMHLVENGHRVAVLAVDPSSSITGGSILGDKTRMEKLATHPSALVRPTACGGWLGGVARGTRESILVCEAAGYDVVLVETVGVGQSEYQVSTMTDFFLLLMVAGAGDELQGIKRGIMEMADAIAINKADGENMDAAKVARQRFQSALHLLPAKPDGWQARVLTCSSINGAGIADVWGLVRQHHDQLRESGALGEKRHHQQEVAMHQALEAMLIDRMNTDPALKVALEAFRRKLRNAEETPYSAAEQLAAMIWPGGTEQMETNSREEEPQ